MSTSSHHIDCNSLYLRIIIKRFVPYFIAWWGILPWLHKLHIVPLSVTIITDCIVARTIADFRLSVSRIAESGVTLPRQTSRQSPANQRHIATCRDLQRVPPNTSLKSYFFDEYKWKEFKWISTMQCSTFKQLHCLLTVLLQSLTITGLSSLDKKEGVFSSTATLSISIIFVGHHTLIVWLYIPLLKNYWLVWIKVNIKKTNHRK